ncbi:hypothetical protein TNCV_2948671 [Trichonephila clavipes]|nr:hypothetical protein TNCV_2948671 [Trichonephila clavipes]
MTRYAANVFRLSLSFFPSQLPFSPPPLRGCLLRPWGGRGSPVVKVTDMQPACHEIEPCAAEDPPCRSGRCMLKLSRLKVLPWCGVEFRMGCQLRCLPRHFTLVQNDEARLQYPSCFFTVRI